MTDLYNVVAGDPVDAADENQVVDLLNSGTVGQIFKAAGGGHSGAFQTDTTLTNPMTTKGDMVTGGTGGTPTRVPAPPNGRIPFSDSAQPSGWSFATPSMINATPTYGGIVLQAKFSTQTTDSGGQVQSVITDWTFLPSVSITTILSSSLLCILTGSAYLLAGSDCRLYIDVDGTSYNVGSLKTPNQNHMTIAAAIPILGLSAGTHVVKLRYQEGGGGTVQVNAATNPTYETLRLVVFEVNASSLDATNNVEIPPWNSSTSYVNGSVVGHSGIVYTCVLANTNQTPPNGTYWNFLGGVTSLAALTDVLVSSPITGEVLTYNSGAAKWENAAPFVPNLSDIPDVAISSPANGEVLTYNSGASKWENAAGGGGSSTLAALTDVAVSSPTNAEVLTYNSGASKWENASAPGGGGGAFGITDFVRSTVYNAGDVVRFDGLFWVALQTTSGSSFPDYYQPDWRQISSVFDTLFLPSVFAFGLGGPSSVTLTPAAGSVGTHISASTTYYYMICPYDADFDLGSPSDVVSYAQTGTPTRLTIAWSQVTGARFYGIFRGTVNDATLISYLSSTDEGDKLSYVDDGFTAESGSPTAADTATGVVHAGLYASAPQLQALGITGSSGFNALVGSNASGAPTTGVHAKGEIAGDDTGKLWYCTVAGTPGTWVQV